MGSDITREMINQWKNDLVTLELFFMLKQRRKEIGDFLVQGGHLGSDHASIAHARYAGTVDALDDILTLNVFEAKKEEETHD